MHFFKILRGLLVVMTFMFSCRNGSDHAEHNSDIYEKKNNAPKAYFKPIKSIQKCKDTIWAGSIPCNVKVEMGFAIPGNERYKEVELPGFPGGWDSLRCLFYQQLNISEKEFIKDSILISDCKVLIDTNGRLVMKSFPINPHFSAEVRNEMKGILTRLPLFEPAYLKRTGEKVRQSGHLRLVITRIR